MQGFSFCRLSAHSGRYELRSASDPLRTFGRRETSVYEKGDAMPAWQNYLTKRQAVLMEQLRYVATHNSRLEEVIGNKRTDVSARLGREGAGRVCRGHAIAH